METEAVTWVVKRRESSQSRAAKKGVVLRVRCIGRGRREEFVSVVEERSF